MLLVVLAVWLTAWPRLAVADPQASPSPSPEPTAVDQADVAPDFNAALNPNLWFSLEDEFSPSYDGLTQSSNQVNVRGQIPLGRIGQQLPVLFAPGHLQLIKFKLPFVTSAPDKAFGGNGDTTLGAFEFLGTLDRKWVVGPVFKLPTASVDDLGSGKWSIGPGVGYTYQHEQTIMGLYSQSFFSFAGPKARAPVSQTQFQPDLTFILPSGWIVGTSQMQFTYNWQNNQWPSVPVGIRIARNFVNSAGRLAAGVEAEKNLVSVDGTPAWTFRINFKYQFSRKKS